MARTIIMVLSLGLVITACGSASTPGASRSAASPLAFSRCMRSHGVPDFPDPGSGGGIQLTTGSGLNPSSPSFQAAQQDCSRLMPGGSGSGQPNAAAGRRLLKVAECMRAHGISGFPDPRTGAPPSSPAGYGLILGGGGHYLAVPATIDLTSPAFESAAALCKFGPPRRGVKTPAPA